MSTPYHILLVDDEPNLHKQVVPILQKKGFTVETANDGEEGLKKLLSEEFDAAVVDLKMPKMDGFSMIKQASANNINIPMLMLTGKGGTEDAFQASALGVKAWIEKSSLDVLKLSEQLFKLIAENKRSIRPILNALALKNFTLFTEIKLKFSPQLNIFIGENATGKTHILKAAYSVIAATAEFDETSPTKLNDAIATKLFNVLRPEKLGNLVSYQQTQAEITLNFEENEYDSHLCFSPDSESIKLQQTPSKLPSTRPVYFSTKELLSIFPEFVEIYENRYLAFEETWRDMCVALGGLKQRKLEPTMQALLTQLETAMGGEIELDKNGRFYLKTAKKGRLEAHLISEGQRKLAMLARLIATGALQRGYLFWDEPESNLNPHLLKEIAPLLLTLSAHGVQIFIATHSLFLLREIEIGLASETYKNLKTRWFGLHTQGDEVVVEQGDDIDDSGDITALDEELTQSARFMKSRR
jgi:CheY-like chemotaxis protein